MDEAALLDALENGRLGAAGLGVFLNEPRIDPRFLRLGNAVLQPRNGSGTRETRMAMAEPVRDNPARPLRRRAAVDAGGVSAPQPSAR